MMANFFPAVATLVQSIVPCQTLTSMPSRRVGAGDGDGEGLAVGDAVGAGVGVASGVAVGSGEAVGTGVAVAVGFGLWLGAPGTPPLAASAVGASEATKSDSETNAAARAAGRPDTNVGPPDDATKCEPHFRRHRAARQPTDVLDGGGTS